MPSRVQDFKQMPFPLPIDASLPEFLAAFRTSSSVVLEAPPGAGKTTRVPPAILSEGAGEVLVLEPRRIAARMAARRVAEKLGERVGETVGYQVRFEDVSGPHTRLRFLTEGVFTRRLLNDPALRSVSAVVLDEFHERRLDGDLALALLRRLQRTARPDLKVIVMSATLDAAPIADYMGGCPIVRSEGRLFPVSVSYAGSSAAPLEDQVAAAVERAGSNGDILVFLPGAAEIRRAMRACANVVSGGLLLPLHGDLSPEEQDRAVLPAPCRKIVLSTNVAESSITLDGVTTVIDSGLARIASDSPWTGIPTLQVQRVSKASAIQRAGRAGRTAPGHAIRLYSEEDLRRRPDQEIPEIQRRELSPMLLELRALRVPRVNDIAWLDDPPQEAIEAAAALLERLHWERDTAAMSRMPLHPRLARLVLDGERRGAGREACHLAAMLSAGEHPDAEPSWRAQQTEKQIRRILRNATYGSEEGLRLAVLAAFPDRVAKRRSAMAMDPMDLQFSNGKPGRLAMEIPGQLLVAIDVEDRREAGPPVVRYASETSPEALVDLFPGRLSEREELIWNREQERVEARRAVFFEEIILEESRNVPDSAMAAAMLAEKAVEAGFQRFSSEEEIESLLARVEFASRHSSIPALSEEDVRDVLKELCAGLRSFSELEAVAGVNLTSALKERVGGERALAAIAPERIALKNRQVKVHYIRGGQPWIASRLQDFFGLRDTPRIAQGQVPLLAHLLAPNQRPVQMTTDLQDSGSVSIRRSGGSCRAGILVMLGRRSPISRRIPEPARQCE